MNLRIHIILFSIGCLGYNDISKPVVKGMVPVVHNVIEVIESGVELRPAEGLVYHDDRLFTGRVISRFENGTTSESIDYISGVKVGYHRKWFSEGHLAYEAKWIAGLPE